MLYCTRCGAPWGVGQFCVRCGVQRPVVGDEITRVPSRMASGGSAPPGPASARRRGGGWGVWFGVLAMVGLCVAGGLYLLTRGGTDSRDTARAPSAGAASGASPAPTQGDGSLAPPSQGAASTPAEPAATMTVTQTATPATDVTDCGDGTLAAGTASCPFALTVAAAYRASGGSDTLTGVYSPVTELYYDLTCAGTAPTECRVGRARILIY